MSRPPAARGLALHFFLWKQLPGQEIGLGGIRCSIFCRVLHQRSSLSLSRASGASSHHAEYGYSSLMQEKYAKNQKMFPPLALITSSVRSRTLPATASLARPARAFGSGGAPVQFWRARRA